MIFQRRKLAAGDRGVVTVTAEPAAPPKPTAPAAPPTVELAELDAGDPNRLLEIARALGFSSFTREDAEREIQAARGRPGAIGEADAILAAAEANGLSPAELRRQARRFRERSSEIGLELTTGEASYAVANQLPGIFIFDDFVRARGGDLGAAAAAFSELAERLGAKVDLGATVDRLAILDPRELGRRAAAFAEARSRSGRGYVRIETALDAVRADPRAHERVEAALAAHQRSAATAQARRLAERATGFQERHPGTSAVDAVAAVQAGEDRRAAASFAERVDVANPQSVARAAGSYQAELGRRGVRVSTVEAVNHVVRGNR